MGEKYVGITDPGKQRKNNEDSFIAQTVFNKKMIAACVIDGVGGYAGGEVAAKLTRDEIIHGLRKLPANMIGHLVTAINDANERIIREKKASPQNEKMACVVTLAVVDIENNLFYFAHVGDTRLYLFRDGSLIKVTRDHSNVGFLEESGRLSEEAAMLHPKRNEVNKALGYETNIALTKDFIDTGESPFLPGDTILLCSDGLTDMIPASKIISILSARDDLRSKAQLLINAANDAGGKDNITVVLVNNDKSPVQHEVTKPLIAIKKNTGINDEELRITEKETGFEVAGVKKNSGNRINRFLVIFCIIFFSGFAWMMYKNYKEKKRLEKPVPVIFSKTSNKQALNFTDSIRASTNKVVNLTDSQPMVITEAISIMNDSLHIIGNGISFVRDSAYAGPAFILSAACKYILFDSVAIENFDVGILVLNRGLHLKKVHFKNCLVPLQFQQQLPDNLPVSGTQAATIFYYNDSLHKQ